MSIEVWFAFAAASALLLTIPGPTVLLIVAHAVSHGRRAALATVAGVTLGDFAAMTASMAGLGALLAASATLFVVLKWFGQHEPPSSPIGVLAAPGGRGAAVANRREGPVRSPLPGSRRSSRPAGGSSRYSRASAGDVCGG